MFLVATSAPTELYLCWPVPGASLIKLIFQMTVITHKLINSVLNITFTPTNNKSKYNFLALCDLKCSAIIGCEIQ